MEFWEILFFPREKIPLRDRRTMKYISAIGVLVRIFILVLNGWDILFFIIVLRYRPLWRRCIKTMKRIMNYEL
jgi:hypothetical protein